MNWRASRNDEECDHGEKLRPVGQEPRDRGATYSEAWNQEEVEYLKKLFNQTMAVTKGDNGILNGTKTRFPNEFARHKTLDLIGDLTLVGHPIKGHILAARSGHKANIELAKIM